MALFVALLVVIIVMQDNRIKKLEVGQEMNEEAIDQLFEIAYPEDECDMCGEPIEPLSFEEWLESEGLPKVEEPIKKSTKCPFKKGDVVKHKESGYITTVKTVPGMKEYDMLDFMDAEKGFVTLNGWNWHADFELSEPEPVKKAPKKKATKKTKKPLTKGK